MKSLLRRSFLTSVTAFFVAIGFIWPGLGLLSIPGLLGLVVLLGRSEHLSRKQFLWQCALFGYVYCGIVLRWVFDINALDLIGDTFYAVIFTVLTYLLMVGALAVGFVVSGYLYRQLGISVHNRTIIFLPAVWVVGEYARSVFFSIFALGDGGSVGQFWNFGVLGYSFIDLPIKYSSRLVGSLGISFLVILTAVALYKIAHRNWRYLLVALVPLLTSILGWQMYKQTHHQGIKVAAVGLHESVESDYEDALISNLHKEAQIDALVLPEYSHFFAHTDGSKTFAKLPESVDLVIDSANERTGEKIRNAVTYYQYDGTILSQQLKSFLIPGGEYLPYIYHMILFYSGNRDLITEFHNNRFVIKSAYRESAYTYKDVRYGALACSGAIAPEMYRAMVDDGAEVLVNSASIASLGVTGSYYQQAEKMARFIAIANARPFIQSARGGPSYIFDQNGATITSTSDIDRLDVIYASVRPNEEKTLYSLLGEWVVYGSIAALGIRIILHAQLHKRLLRSRNG